MALGIEYYSKRYPYLPPLASPTHSLSCSSDVAVLGLPLREHTLLDRAVVTISGCTTTLVQNFFPLPSHPPLSSYTFRFFSPCRDFLTSSIANIYRNVRVALGIEYYYIALK